MSGILLLRHDRATGRPGVVQLDVAEFGCAPKDDVLGQPGQVDCDHGEHERRLGREVPRRRWRRWSCRPQSRSPVPRRWRRGRARATSRPAPRTVRRHRRALVEVGDPVDVAQQRMRVRQQMMREQNRLRGLQVGLAGHDRGRVRGGLGRERVDDVETPRATRRTASRSHIRNSVATWSLRERPARSRPPRSGPTRSIRPRSSAPCTSSSVGIGPKLPVATSWPQAVQPGEQSVALFLGEQAGLMQHPGVGFRRRDVVGRQHPVEVGRLAQCGQLGGGPSANRPPHSAPSWCSRRPRDCVCSYASALRRSRSAVPAPRSSRTGRGRARSPWRWTGRTCRPRRRWPG